MSSCYTCDRTFRSPRALQDHGEAKKHRASWNCIPSQRTLANEIDALYARIVKRLEYSIAHSPGYCYLCNKRFIDQASLYRHVVENSNHNWCFICSRGFPSKNALNQHLKVHSAERTFNCPLCPKSFIRPSSIAHHIESGCHKITRHQVTAAVHSLKVAPTISISRRLEGPKKSAPSIVTYSATERSFNGVAYECYLCHRSFRTLASLNSHLNSAAHDSDQFRCPKCKRKFTLISGLIQHIESECCGIARFQQVMNEATSLTDRFERLLLK